jgi:hypothetical protein
MDMVATWRDTPVNARPAPATGPQVGYILSLTQRLKGLLEDGDELAQRLEKAAEGEISKQDASGLIEVLIDAVRKLGGTVHTTPTSFQPPPQTPRMTVTNYTAQSQKAASLEHRARHLQWLKEREAFHDAQAPQFGDFQERPPPGGSNYMKVWKKKRNQLLPEHWGPPIEYGWAWECTHPSHAHRVRGGSHLGRNATLANAQLHWNKYHKEEE